AGVGVAERVQGRHREGDGRPRRGGGRGGEAEVRGPRVGDRDGVAGAGDAAGGRVGRGDRRGAARLEGDVEGAGAVRRHGGGRQVGLAIRAGEMHRARVAGGSVVELVLRRHRDVEAGARDRSGGGAHTEVRGGGRADRDGAAGARDAARGGVGRG